MADAYANNLAALTDDDLVEETSRVIQADWFSPSIDPRVQACSEEACRRQKPWLYAKGWNHAYRREGNAPDELDLRLATPEGYREHYGDRA